MPTFDRDDLIMTLDAGLTDFDWEYYYDEWKQWSLGHVDNRRCPPAFSTSGGEDVITGELQASGYFFFRNDLGWRMRPAEEDATMYPTGNLIPSDSSLPIFIPTIGGYTVFMDGLQPISQRLLVGSGVSAQDVIDISDAVWQKDKATAIGTAGSIGEFINDQLVIIEGVLINKTETDPVTGVMTIYAKDDTTVLFQTNIWENVAATTPYAGNAVNRRDRLT